MKELWRHPIGRHLVVAVAVKFALLLGLWWVFFSDTAPRPDSAQVGAAVLREPVREPSSGKE